jgi:hypothetical protein
MNKYMETNIFSFMNNLINNNKKKVNDFYLLLFFNTLSFLLLVVFYWNKTNKVVDIYVKFSVSSKLNLLQIIIFIYYLI